jgi:hypothetical protein
MLMDIKPNAKRDTARDTANDTAQLRGEGAAISRETWRESNEIDTETEDSAEKRHKSAKLNRETAGVAQR